MKKAIAIFAVGISVLSCKKMENVENAGSQNADSAQPAAVSNAVEMDSTGKILALEAEKTRRNEDFKESLPKLDSGFVISQKTATEKSKDSLSKKSPIPTVKVVVAPEKIIHEKKVVYKTVTKPAPSAAIREMKNAYLEFDAENLPKSLQKIREISENYNAKIISEKQSAAEEIKVSSLEMSLPAAEFSNFINALEFGEIGALASKNIQNVGNGERAAVSVTINSSGNFSGSGAGFGGKTLAAISTGGAAIGSIILFLLPFWPLILLGAVAIFFYKKRRGQGKTQ